MKTERSTQDRVIQLLVDKLNYAYLGNLKEQENSNIREADLTTWLTHSGYAPGMISKALFDFKKTAALNPGDDLYPVNQAVYSQLRYGVKVKDEHSNVVHTVWLIDWENPAKNHFAVAEEVTVKSKNTKRPDIVLYVNGIALGVFELKSARVSVSEGIRQNLDNQQEHFIKPFFSTIQCVFAGNDSQGLYYGTIKTPEKFFLKWKEENAQHQPHTPILDLNVSQLCEKERFLELIHDFVVFDGGIKKLCRPNQYFGVKAAQAYIKRREGGIIWHTQGSGKSLTMVWLAKWIRENQTDARLLIITDRSELDEQIEKVFSGVSEQIYRTKSGKDLLQKLNETSPWLMCTLIHKFGGKDEKDTQEFIRELNVPADFQPKGNLFVFIDECHRTQSGDLHKAMKGFVPNALFIGFTGTPLLKKDKQTSMDIFGTYIHTYKFDEAVKDNVVLDLLYEARDVDQRINDQKGVDEWFEASTRGMNDLPKAELKQQWGTLQKILSSKDRLQKVAFDITKDFKMKPRLSDGRGNAMLVTRSIYEACRYYEIFQSNGFKKCAIVTSFEPSINTIKGESTGDGETEKLEQYEIYQKMLQGKNREQFEKYVKKKFIDEPANMQLLIVVDKLLTGFDAPACTYLYIDKEMRDHGLFQAICRVNRTADEGKEFGYIVDYKNLFNSLNNAISDYTSGAFDDFDKKDIENILVDRLKKSKERLDDTLEAVEQMVKDVEAPKEVEQYIHYFCGDIESKDDLKKNEDKRLLFYKAVVALIRAHSNLAPEMQEAGYTQAEAARIKSKVNDFVEKRDSIKIASGEYIDLKKYEPDMRQLLDMYLSAEPSRIISNFGDATLLQLIVEKGISAVIDDLPKSIRSSEPSVADTIVGNIRKVIIQEMPINPMYYERMSTLLQELIEQRKKGALSYEQFLKEMEALAKQVIPEGTKNQYPESIDTPIKQAVYEILEDEPLTLIIASDVTENMEPNWKGNTLKERKVRYAVRKHIVDSKKAEEIFEVIKNQKDNA